MTKNLHCEYSNFGSEISCKEKTMKILIYKGLFISQQIIYKGQQK